jgi:hypothetical protein
MKTVNVVLSMLFIGLVNLGFSQKIIKVQGDLAFLKSEKEINIEYDYSKMGVGKFKTEEEYVNSKVKEYNEKEAGKGDKWKESWETSRQRVYQPKFEELFNKNAGISGSQNNGNAKYTLIVKTVFTEPGFNVGVASKPAAVSFEYIFVETDSKNVVATYTQVNVPGAQAMGYDFDTSTRISESYAKAGKMLGGFIAKNNKK